MHPHQRVDPPDAIVDRRAVALHQATGHHHPLKPRRLGLLDRDQLTDDLVGLLTRVFEESAGVDHDDIGVVFVGAELAPGFGQLAEHFLGINGILRAAQGNKSHAGRFAHQGSSTNQPPRRNIVRRWPQSL
jgi:hypothetical protein